MKKSKLSASVFRILSSKYLLIGFVLCFLLYFFGVSSMISVPTMTQYQGCYQAEAENKIIVPEEVPGNCSYLYAYTDRNQEVYRFVVRAVEHGDQKTIFVLEPSVLPEGFPPQDTAFTVEIPRNDSALLKKIFGA